MSERMRLPPRRPIVTARLEDPVTGQWHLTAGFDQTGTVREFFLDAAGQVGTVFDNLVHDMCIVLSRDALQHGLTVADLVRNLSDRPPSLLANALTTALRLQQEHGAETAALIRKAGA